jgi:Mn2+/Fe2+ NRAMP family transporter
LSTVLYGITDIQTAGEAAEALRPIAGNLAFLLFALGIIGTGLLAIPVLAGSGAYAVAELFGWPSTLEAKFPEAIGFYAIIFAATVIGFAMGFLPINPIQLLVWTAVINGIVAAPIMAMMMLIVSNRSAMGRFHARPFACLGWLGGNSFDGSHGRCIAVVTVAVSSDDERVSALGQKLMSERFIDLSAWCQKQTCARICSGSPLRDLTRRARRDGAPCQPPNAQGLRSPRS